MAYDRLKEEMIRNIGGINEKASNYVIGENEVLSLRNASFQKPGAWESRPGYTLYATGPTTIPVTGMYEFSKSDGASYLLMGMGETLYKVQGSSVIPLGGGFSGDQIDFTTMNDICFLADGTVFKKFDGNSVTNYGLPVPNYTAIIGAIGFTTGSGSTVIASAYYMQFAYLNKDGYLGPLTDSAFGVTVAGTTVGTFFVNSLSSTPFMSLFPTGYGITSLVTFISPTLISTPNNNVVNAGGLMKTEVATTSVTGQPVGFQFAAPKSPFGSTLSVENTTLIPIDYSIQQYDTWNSSEDFFLDRIFSFSLVPKFVDLYQNKLFMSGFSGDASNLFFTEATFEERVFIDNFFPIRTNDNNEITGKVPYQGSLIVFKEESITEVSGTSALLSNSDAVINYGCLNNKCIVQFNSRLWFLDRKGVAEYNGINTQIVSNRVEETFDRMNPEQAKRVARAVHWKRRNEVWFAIPLDDSVENNAIVVHDYLANAWTVYEGFNPSEMVIAEGNGFENTVFWGGYRGTVNRMGESLPSDFGATINMSIQTRFHARHGVSSEELWRRFFVHGQADSNLPITLEFIPNYGTDISLTAGVTLSSNKVKYDLGLPAYSMSVNMSMGSSTDKMVINGYTIESRFLRNE